MRVRRARSSPSAPHSRLTRGPLGGLIVAVGLSICAANPVSAQPRGDEAFLRTAKIQVYENHSAAAGEIAVPPSPVALTPAQIKELRSIFVSAFRRSIASDAKAKKNGAIWAGAGCNTNEYRVTFSRDTTQEAAVLHIGGRWMSGNAHVGSIDFSEADQTRFERLFGVSRPCH
jgi:hypothetical protein